MKELLCSTGSSASQKVKIATKVLHVLKVTKLLNLNTPFQPLMRQSQTLHTLLSVTKLAEPEDDMISTVLIVLSNHAH